MGLVRIPQLKQAKVKKHQHQKSKAFSIAASLDSEFFKTITGSLPLVLLLIHASKTADFRFLYHGTICSRKILLNKIHVNLRQSKAAIDFG
ncbi:MAG: hypothetical protein KJ578_02185 [Bacteroidetes bacterium]|nr:hypothetical protein [Bacteroidota bacterium]MBU1577942.1 hypothetical protein [Bacteroidota bacterium]MBU2556573.1 hypothetical protein [Bacteroidota bacterium]